MEAAGFSTISLSTMLEVTASTRAPRIAGIEHPFGLTLGLPGDASGQRAVLLATLGALQSIAEPGGAVHLPFEWSHKLKLSTLPPVDPPIVTYLKRRPWALARFVNRNPPEPDGR